MRSREWARVIAAHPDLDLRVATWRAGYPDGTLEEAVRDLELWPRNPRDSDAQRLVWLALRRLGDPVAARLGFPGMRLANIREVVRHAAPMLSSPGHEGAQTAGETG
jgi:hypothetical protein